MVKNKDDKSLKTTEETEATKTTNEHEDDKIYVTFRKYDQFGNDVKCRIDITDKVKEAFHINDKGQAVAEMDQSTVDDGLYYAAQSFVGLEYIYYNEEENGDGRRAPEVKYPVSRWEDRENYRNKVSDLINVSLVNAKQADAMMRLIDDSFNDFFERTYRRFF